MIERDGPLTPKLTTDARGLQRAIGNRAMARLTQSRRTLARDMKRDEKVAEGTFTLNLTTESHAGAKNGVSGTISFRPKDSAPDSTKIRLFQVLRDEDLTTGKDYVWTGHDADRNKFHTQADPMRPGIEPGWGVDINPGAVSPRTKLSDPAVSPYYRDYWPNAGSSQDGSKAGKAITAASLWDYPGSSGNRRFSFETVAKAVDTGHVYGSVIWGFTISDASKGTVEKEYGAGRNVTTQTTDEALRVFDEYYGNPGAGTAPKT